MSLKNTCFSYKANTKIIIKSTFLSKIRIIKILRVLLRGKNKFLQYVINLTLFRGYLVVNMGYKNK